MRITVRPDTLAFNASRVNTTAGTRINVGLLLVALRNCTTYRPITAFWSANPMVHEAARQTIGEVHRKRA